MTDPYVIIGSGPSAAGTALALRAQGIRDITVLDVGGQLEDDRRDIVAGMAEADPDQWTSPDLSTITEHAVATSKGELPQKRSYGSDFPFRDLGQLDAIDYSGRANSSPVSSAYGGFSNVWGAQLMPFSRSTFETWPISYADMTPHYRAILDEVPLAGEHDDFEETFPFLSERAQPLPPVSPRTTSVLQRYGKHRTRVRRAGVTIGHARLAMQARECRLTSLCMTGCPYGLIYSASQTFDKLRAQGAVRYTPGVLATRVGQDEQGPYVYFKNLASGQFSTIHAERIFVACGGIGSTRLVVGSLPNAPTRIDMPESIQFAVPFLSTRSTGDPRTQNTFTLNQFNVLISFDSSDYHTSHIHCYPYNPAVLAALPGLLRNRFASPLTAQMLGRLTIGLGYLPSWAAPTIPLRFSRSAGDNLPHLTIGSETPISESLMLREVMRRLRSIGPYLDLHPVTPAMRVSATAKSYHFGGSIPHSRDPEARALASDTLGRVPGWDRIHLVDGAVLPSVPATTFTFTVMANAHRIASAAVSGATR